MNIRNNYILLSVIAVVGVHAADDTALRGGHVANLSRLLKKGGNGGGKPFDNDTTTTKPTDGPLVCPLDVYTCPDGSYDKYVSRDPSNDCKFPCCYLGKIKGDRYYYGSGGCDADGYMVDPSAPIFDPSIAPTCHDNESACSALSSDDPSCFELGCEDKGQTCGFCNPICVDANNPDDGSSPIVLNCGGLCYGSACCQENPGLPSTATYCF